MNWAPLFAELNFGQGDPFGTILAFQALKTFGPARSDRTGIITRSKEEGPF
jgi:hypothetical protein